MELKIPPLVVVCAIAIGQWLCSARMVALSLEIPFRTPLASIVALCGFGFATAGVLAFRRAKTTVDPTRPFATTTIVTTSVYRISRNPMYVGFLLSLTSFAIACANGAAFLWLPLFVLYLNRFQIGPEERYLTDKFGDAYANYRARVRRWI
jgi:protein-S-isoprenylcysteine O-methyltransferase Ste14